MNDREIRERLHGAIGEFGYPPDLSSRAAARLRRPLENEPRSWIFAIVAAVLAVALVATILIGSHALRLRSDVTVQPPPSQRHVTATCPTFSSETPHAVGAIRMVTVTTGWAHGGYRTKDGGAHWVAATPAALRDGMPAPALANGLYPPGYADFYLDGGHAWLLRTYSSTTNCADEVVVFATSDGGRTWTESRPIGLGLGAGWGAGLIKVQFLDASRGWIWIPSGPIVSNPGWPNGPALAQAQLFATTDGGVTWRLVSVVDSKVGPRPTKECPFPYGDIEFVSPSIAWLPITCQAATELLTSTDGGLTWRPKTLPCGCGSPDVHFFDATHAVIVGPAVTLATADGGTTWESLPPPPNSGFLLAIDYVDATHWWAVLTPPNWQKGQETHDSLYRTTDGGRTWSLVQSGLPIGFPVDGIDFVDDQHGFVFQPQNAVASQQLGPATEIVTTSDGGITWKTVIASVTPS